MNTIENLDSFNAFPHPTPAILVVEDDVFMKPILRRILRQIDPTIEMHWATTAQAARRKLEQTQFGLVIVDCLLPAGDSGLALWRECHARRPDLPFLMVSGLSETTIQRMNGTELPAPPYLSKPFFPRECREKICAALFA